MAKQIDQAEFIQIQILHKILFKEGGNRRCRRQVRKFQQYAFDPFTKDYQNLLNHNLSDLTQIATILGLIERTKEDLVIAIPNALSSLERLKESQEEDNEETEENEDAEEETEDEEIERRNNQEKEIIFSKNPASVNLRELDDFISEFDGSSAHSIKKWIQDIEDEALMQKLSELQTLTLARRRLARLAKTFYENARGPKSWKQLKEFLIKQFLPRLDMTEIHRQLGNRRLEKNEDISKYFIHLQNIASRGKLKDRLLIDYIIRGMGDPHAKLFVAEAKTLRELQEKLNT